MNKYGQNTRLTPFGSFSKQAKYVKCKSWEVPEKIWHKWLLFSAVITGSY